MTDKTYVQGVMLAPVGSASLSVGIDDREVFSVPGLVAVFTFMVVLLISAWWAASDFLFVPPWYFVPSVLVLLFIGAGFFVNRPNKATVFTFFGQFVGTNSKPGLWWTVPFFSGARVNLRTRNFVTPQLKVNDLSGNPIDISSTVLWRVVSPAIAVLTLEDYVQYVEIQSEAALRALASSYAYDDHEREDVDGKNSSSAPKTTLRSGGEEIRKALIEELRARLEIAGVLVEDARITHLAYSPEIAAAMLQRQQAKAVLSARRILVDGAVDITLDAIKRMEKDGDFTLDGDKRVAVTSNMLLVMVGNHEAHPVINVGTLYQG